MFIRLVVLFIFGVFYSMANAQEASSQSSHSPVVAIQHWQTAQHVPVYFVASHGLPMVDIQVLFQAGSVRDGDKPGLAQFTNAMLDEGTTRLTVDEIAARFDDVGAVFSNHAERDQATVALRSLIDPQYFDSALSTFNEVLTQPIFPKSNFERLKKQMLVSLNQNEQDPVALAKKTFMGTLYGNLPYNHPALGTIAGVNSITLEDIKAFYHRYYNASNAIVVMVGDMSTEQAHHIAEQITQSLPKGQPADPLVMAKSAIDSSQSQHVYFPAEQTTVLMGTVGITPQDPDYFPLMLGNYTLGGSGLVSRLFHQVREEHGLVYQIVSQLVPLAAQGPFFVFLQTRNAEAQRAIQMTQRIVQDFIEQGPSQAELDAAKKYTIGSFPLNLASNADILNQVAYIAFYGLPLDYLDTFRDKVNAVTVEEIKTALLKRLRPEEFLIVTVGGKSTE
ncbi:MAG: pitrilysin family protein [Gammaproteobacteria bacterium]